VVLQNASLPSFLEQKPWSTVHVASKWPKMATAA
jgi:hypothetical protein